MRFKTEVFIFLMMLSSRFIWFQITRGDFSYDFLGTLVIASLTTFISHLFLKHHKKP